jgi:hypothetical protein
VGGTDLLREAVAELYAAAPHEFISRRGEFVARARAAGEPAAAKQIGALRKPTQSAWVVNQLVRSVPTAAGELSELGAQLRRAQRTLDGGAIRELSLRRRELIDELTRQAFTVTAQRAPAGALREEVATTLAAALADPGIADELATGAMDRAARSDGFGSVAPTLTLVTSSAAAPPVASATSNASAQPSAKPPAPVKRPAQPPARSPAPVQRPAGRPAESPPAARPATPAQQRAAERRIEAAERRIEAAEQKARRAREREALAQAKAAAAEADTAAKAATRAEQDLESTVQRLTEDLADAREELASVRVQARRARARQARARQALDRLSGGP